MILKLLTSDNVKKLLNKILGTAASVIIAFLLLYFTFKNVDLNQVMQIIFNSSIPYFILFVASFYLSHLLRAARWKLIIKSFKEISFLNSFTSIMVGYGVNCGVPRLGELYRSFFIGKLERISRTAALGTIIVERIIDVFFLGLSVFVSVIIYSGNLYSQIVWLKNTLIYGSIIIIVFVLFLFALVKKRDVFITLAEKFFSVFSTKRTQYIKTIIQKLLDGFGSIKDGKIFLWIINYSILIMLVYGLTSYLAFYALRMNFNNDISFEMGWIVMTLSAFGIVIPTPGGTGSYHIIVKSVLETLYGFSSTESSAFAIMTHSFSYIAFISTMFTFVKLTNIFRTKSNLEKVNFISVIKSAGKEDENI